MERLAVLEVEFEYEGQSQAIFPAVLHDQKEVILIDCGYPGFMPLIEAAAEKQGIDMGRLTKLIITHHDFDHMGSAAQFKVKYPHIEIVSSTEEAPYINGDKKSLRLEQAESIFDSLADDQKENARGFHQLLESIESVDVDISVKDKEHLPWCGGVEIIATPGHMPGHISLYIRESRTLIAGDALVIENGELAIANPQYTLNAEDAKKSIVKLMDHDIDRIICYHGGVYDKDIKSALKSIIDEGGS